jgi:hypothetical protein
MKAISVIQLSPYIYSITYEDGISGSIDLTPTSPEDIFVALEHNNLWKHPKINRYGSAIYRNDEIDVDAIGCYIEITGKNPFIS